MESVVDADATCNISLGVNSHIILLTVSVLCIIILVTSLMLIVWRSRAYLVNMMFNIILGDTSDLKGLFGYFKTFLNQPFSLRCAH